MKIAGAQVLDPAHRGYANSPDLYVTVDSEMQPSGPVETAYTRNGQGFYRHQHFGPFVKFMFYNNEPSRNTGALGGEDGFPLGAWSSRAGAYNVEVKPAKQLIDVSIYTPQYPSMAIAGYGLEIDRAESLLKKHAPEWRLGLDETAARQGDITWVPEEILPSCLFLVGGFPNGKPCLELAYHPYQGRPLGLCDAHLATVNREAAERRARNRR